MSEVQTKPSDVVLDEILARRARADEDPAIVERDRKRALLARVRVLTEGKHSNNNHIRTPDPEYAYLWAYHHTDRINYLEGLQFELVRDQDTRVQSNFKKQDGTHVRGDLILMRVHKDIHDALNALRELKAYEAVEGAKEELVNWGAMNGVPVRRN